MTLNREISSMFLNLTIELMFKWELHCLQGCFRKPTGKEDI